MGQPSTAGILTAELAAVTPPLCGWTQPGHDLFVCQRAKDHASAQILTDVHVMMIDGQPVTAAA